MTRTCLYCNSPIKGRADKKFCDADCRGAYHNQKKVQGSQLIKIINSQLLINYRALRECFRQGTSTTESIVNKQLLRDKGFDPTYHTSRKIISGRVYYFIYDIGYTLLSTEEVSLMSIPEDYMKQLDSGQAEETTSEYGF